MAGKAAGGGGWEFDEFDDGALKIVGDKTLRDYKSFLEVYAGHLLDIEDALDESLGDAWDFHLDPIALQLTPHEHTELLDLVKTDNKVFNKVISVFLALCRELSALKEEAVSEFYGPLLLYGEGVTEESVSEGEAQVAIGQLMPFLQRLSVFVGRVNLVVKNVIHQLAMLYSPTPTMQAIHPQDVHLLPVIRHLGEVLTVLITLDEIIAQNEQLRGHWKMYKRMVKAVSSNTDLFGVTKENLQPFQKFVLMLEGQLLDSMLFQNCIEQTFDDMTVSVSQNQVFKEELSTSIRLLLAQLEPRLGAANERKQRHEFVGLCGLFIFHAQVFKTADKRLIKGLWDQQRRVPSVHLYGTVIITPNEFLVRRMPSITKGMEKKQADFPAARAEWLARRDASIVADAQSMYLKIVSWMVLMENSAPKSANLSLLLGRQAGMVIQGVLYAYEVRNYVTTFVNLHLTLGVPMNKSHVKAVFRMIELMKAIEQSFHRRSMFIADTLGHVTQSMTFNVLKILRDAGARVQADKKYSAKNLDVLAAINLLQSMTNGPATSLRRLAIDLAMGVATQAKVFDPKELDQLRGLQLKIAAVATLRESIREACDTSFFFWHTNLVPLYLRDLYDNPTEAHRLHYLFSALRDIEPLVKRSQKVCSDEVAKQFEQEIRDALDEQIVRKLCGDIETDLRLQVHTGVVATPDRNPFKIGLKDLTHFLRVTPLRFFNKAIDIKTLVTHYLDTTFYNLTTVALHDWKSYGLMRNLATQKYGLNMQDSYLPSQQLEQGLDVLMIMRNIHVFVRGYNYNLNNQIFVEKKSNNKFLNTINIRHVANSIRTHGTGIMNTTVNFTFQFLAKKFFMFSQFLFDDHIKSRLLKDVRFFRDVREKTDQRYPYERAEKFTKIIRKLGTNANGSTYLDQFRELVTQIGNAMGYIRMIRSGGLNMCSKAIRFVPDLDDIVSFEDFLAEAKEDTGQDVPEETRIAAANLDAAVQNLVKNFAEGSDYFKMLVDIFAKEFRDRKNSHLLNFHIIVPPLTISFIEHIISAKDKINKKNKEGAAFTDDGFAMGVAYILKLLDQYQSFDALHWFRACRAHYANERAKVQQNAAKARDDTKLQEASQLSMRRIARYEKEMDMLFYSLTSARIFFRADKTAAEEKAEKAEQAAAEAGDDGAAAAPPAADGPPAPPPAASGPPPPPAASGPPPPPAAPAGGGGPPPPPPPPPPPM